MVYFASQLARCVNTLMACGSHRAPVEVPRAHHCQRMWILVAPRPVQPPLLAADVAMRHYGVDQKNIAVGAANLGEDTSRVLIQQDVRPATSVTERSWTSSECVQNAEFGIVSPSAAQLHFHDHVWHLLENAVCDGVWKTRSTAMFCVRRQSTVGCPCERQVWAAREFAVTVLAIPKDELWASVIEHAQGHVGLMVFTLGHVVLVCGLETAWPCLEALCTRDASATTNQPREGSVSLSPLRTIILAPLQWRRWRCWCRIVPACRHLETLGRRHHRFIVGASRLSAPYALPVCCLNCCVCDVAARQASTSVSCEGVFMCTCRCSWSPDVCETRGRCTGEWVDGGHFCTAGVSAFVPVSMRCFSSRWATVRLCCSTRSLCCSTCARLWTSPAPLRVFATWALASVTSLSGSWVVLNRSRTVNSSRYCYFFVLLLELTAWSCTKSADGGLELFDSRQTRCSKDHESASMASRSLLSLL